MIVVLSALLDVGDLLTEVVLRPQSCEASLISDVLMQLMHVDNGQL